MKIGFCTLGCKVNQYETEAIKEKFSINGWEIKDFNEECDAYLINTCSVTSLSDRKSRQMIRRAHEKNKNAIIAVCGCYAQVSPEEIEKIEGVNIVIGTTDKLKAYELINEAVNKNIVRPLTNKESYEDMEITLFDSKTRAIIKVQDGCNNFCSYCIIPYARGRIRSRNPKKVYNECQKLSENGFLEVVLSGIHVCSYGRDLENFTLCDLLYKIHSIDIKRIRLSSIEPNAFNDDFFNMLKELNKICHHFHISLQSGCDETLKRMNRKYNSSFYKGICNRLIEEFPDTAITTDVIVGFPGETEEEFNKTVEFIKSIPFYKIHTFKYSVREGTVAANMPDQIPPDVKEKRSKIIIDISNEKQKEFERKYVGKTVEILVENKNKNGYYMGHTSNYIPVFVKSENNICDTLIKVEIKEYKNNMLIGKTAEDF